MEWRRREIDKNISTAGYRLFAVCCTLPTGHITELNERKKCWQNARQIWLLILLNISFCVLLFFFSLPPLFFAPLSCCTLQIYCCVRFFAGLFGCSICQLQFVWTCHFCAKFANSQLVCALCANGAMAIHVFSHFISLSVSFQYSFNILINCIRAAAQTIYLFRSYFFCCRLRRPRRRRCRCF